MSQKKLTIRFTAKNLRAVSERKEKETAPCLNVKSDSKLKLPGFSNKRNPELLVDDVPEGKRRKMDQSVKRHCSNILKELLSHRGAGIFSQPVDPVALRIPDYFSIISDPMDLGTIKSKLEDNLYFSSEEFAADVCLTFSNAMLYFSSALQYAKELDHCFKRRWKNQLASGNHQNKGVGLIRNRNGSGLNNTQHSADSAKKLKSDSNSANLTPAKKKVNGLNSLSEKVVRKGACNLVNSKQSVSSVSPVCSLCRGVPRQCGHQKSNKIPTTSSNDKSLKEVNTKSRDNDRKVLLTQKSVSDHNSEGPLMDDESLKKALRVAKLKCPFADTIAKANGGKADLSKIHEERERLERLQREEAAKIRTQREEEKKMIIEKKRQAARLALEEMERTLEVEHKLEDLTQRYSAEFSRGFGVQINKRTYQFLRPGELHGLGLVLKVADGDEELFLNEEREEGEISP